MNDDFPEIDTGNGYANNLSATTNDRLKKTVVELRDLKSGIKDLNANLVNFSTSSDKYSKRLIFLTWVLVAFTVLLVVMTFVLIRDAREQTSSQNNIALNAQFFNSSDLKIINAIENKTPILTENKGQFTDAQLDNYLGDFDTIESSYNDKLLTESDLCDSFSYYIGITAQNPEIQNYIISQQKNDSGFFVSLSDLVKITSESKNPNCQQ